MICPECGGNTRVPNVRTYQDELRDIIYTQRRRECLECKHRFNTIEITQDVWEAYTTEEEAE